MKIKKIENVGKKQTWDIEVKSSHHYLLSNGCVSHNTLSILADCSSSIEPIFGKKYTKTVLNGTKLDLSNKYNNVDDKLLITAHDISVKKHLEMQAFFQRYTDNSVSKTINLKKSATVDDVREAFLLAHDLELKGCTVYREGSRDGPLQITTEGQLSECDSGKCAI